MGKSRQTLTVFVDSSVLFAAVNSPIGGSAKLFTLQNIRLLASKVVLAETERNVRKKLLDYHLDRFFELTEQLQIIPQKPNKKLIEKAKEVIVEKDAVILAEVKQAKAGLVVTLDKKHFFTDKTERFIRPARVVTPKMLIDSYNYGQF